MGIPTWKRGSTKPKLLFADEVFLSGQHRRPGHAGAAGSKAPEMPADRPVDGSSSACGFTAIHPGRTPLRPLGDANPLEGVNVFAPVPKPRGFLD